MKKITDFRDAMPIIPTIKAIETITEKKKALAGVFVSEQCAIVAPDAVDFGMARMHCGQIEPMIEQHMYEVKLSSDHFEVDLAKEIARIANLSRQLAVKMKEKNQT
jgi:hypothetical protein